MTASYLKASIPIYDIIAFLTNTLVNHMEIVDI